MFKRKYQYQEVDIILPRRKVKVETMTERHYWYRRITL